MPVAQHRYRYRYYPPTPVLYLSVMSSVTRWSDYFSIFGRLKQWKLAQKCDTFAKECSAFRQIRNEQSKFYQVLVDICQSGEFLPNLVTLVPTNPGWLRYKLPLNGCLKSLGYSVTSMSLNNIQCAIWLAVVRTRDSSRPIRPQQISGSSSTRLRRRWSEVVSSAWCRSTPSSSRWRTLQTCRPVTT